MRWMRRLAWALLAVLGLWLLLWLALPPLARSQIEKQATQRLGRAVTVGQVSIKPWSLEFRLLDVTVAHAPAADRPAEPQFQVHRIYANLSARSLWELAPVVDALAVNDPVLRLRREADGRTDIDDVLARFATPQPERAADEPLPRLALYNVTLDGGAIDIDDRLAGRSHTVRDMALALPFLSTLPGKREVEVQPRLDFEINGSRVESEAYSLPFAPSRKTRAKLQTAGLDLSPYLAYLPDDLPARLQEGRLDIDVDVAFEQPDSTEQPVVELSGRLTALGLQMQDTEDRELLTVEQLAVDVASLKPLQRSVAISRVDIVSPRLAMRRDARGEWVGLQGFLGAPAPSAGPAAASPAAPGKTPADSAATDRPPESWHVRVDEFQLMGGRVQVADAAVRPATNLEAHDIALFAQGLAWPMDEPLPIRASAQVMGARLALQGEASARKATLGFSLGAMDIAPFAPYWAQVFKAPLAGRVSTEATLHWQAEGQSLSLDVAQLGVAQLQIGQGRAPAVRVRQLSLTDARVEMNRQTVALGDVAVDAPRIAYARDSRGRWTHEDWLAPAAAPAAGASSRRPQAATPSAAWQASLASLRISDGELDWDDGRQMQVGQPVQLRVRQLGLTLGTYAQVRSAGTPIEVKALLSSRRGPRGQLDLRGTLGEIVDWVPRSFDSQRLAATRLPLQALAPYVPALSQLDIHRADGSWTGPVSYRATPAGPRLSASGDLTVEGVRADLRMPDGLDAEGRAAWAREDHQLLSWREWAVRGVKLTLAPDRRTELDLASSRLTDLFARLVVTPQGELNLQGLYGEDEPAAEAAVATRQPGQVAVSQVRKPASPPAGDGPGSAPRVNVGPLELINARIAFNDQFVQPNYRADLSSLTGRLGAFSSVAPEGQPQMAELELQGLAQETAELFISGRVNPLAQPLMLDIRARVNGLDLPPLSPYSMKYAGYGIERGKLSMDVRYEIKADGQLTATNRVVLNQLAFGDKVDGSGSSLPVKLAVALLADRRGVIDIDLPVRGSLNDPQFSMGGLIWRAFVNLIGRAVTSPFSLLGSAFAGTAASELSTIAFAPGSKALDAQARASLDKVAQAMLDKPALNLTLTGLASHPAEQLAFQRVELAKQVGWEAQRLSLIHI